MTLVIVVGTGIRLETGCTNDCFCTVMVPPEVAAIAWSCSNTHVVAAPMPRTGSVWLDRVCLVPNWTSRWIVASIRRGSIRRISWRSAGSKWTWSRAGPCPAGEPYAGAADRAIGAAMAAVAVAAEAERNARRLGPAAPEMFVSIHPTQSCCTLAVRGPRDARQRPVSLRSTSHAMATHGVSLRGAMTPRAPDTSGCTPRSVRPPGSGVRPGTWSPPSLLTTELLEPGRGVRHLDRVE